MTNYDSTGPQKRAITKLAMALKITEPIEERPMTQGDAGRLIRTLYARLNSKRRKK